MTVSNKILLTVILMIILVLAVIPLPQSNLWVRELFNAGHTFLFLIISFILYRQLATSGRFASNWPIYVIVLISGLLLGVLIELLQNLTAREVSLQDIYRDLAGVVTGLLLAVVIGERPSPAKAAVLLFVSILLLVFSVRPLAQLSWNYYQRSKHMPVLFEAGAHWAESFVRLSSSKIKISEGAAEVTFHSARYPSFRIIEPEPDWRTYSYLCLDIDSDREHVTELFLRVHDRSHNHEHGDRFNKKLMVKPGLNHFEFSLATIKHVPDGRTMDMSDIAELVLFASEPEEEIVLKLGDIYLK